MPQHSRPDQSAQSLRAKIIGLGERSIRKSYYPELQKKLHDISRMNESLERRVEERTAELSAMNAALNQEILERQQAEQSLEQALRTLRDFHSIVNRSPAVVCRWRAVEGWPIDFISENVAQFGYAVTDFTSGRLSWADVVHADDIPRLLAELDHYAREGICEFSQEYRIFTRSGELRWVEDHDLFLPDADGIFTHLQGIILDVTERKKAAEERARLYQALELRAGQLRALARQLTEAEERERQRLAQVLHDHLQQILVAAKLKVDRVLRRPLAEPLTSSLKQTVELLDQALTESRSLTAELGPPILYDAGLAAGLEWLARQMHERHGLHVHLETDVEAASVAKDIAVLLFQTVRELLFNVVKHAQAETASVQITSLDHDRIRLVVEDQGVGFNPQELENQRLGDRFGLFSIRERLSFVGGYLNLESKPRQGTRITIEVPLPPAAQPAVAVPLTQSTISPRRPPAVSPVPPSPESHPCQIRVLLADDHPILRKGLADLLHENREIQVVGEAGDGEEAVQLARQTHPDVVLMDVTMPNVDGVEATRRLTAELPEIRVIGLSMHEKTDMARAMHEAGARLYMNKSTPGEDLIAAIRTQARHAVRDSQTH